MENELIVPDKVICKASRMILKYLIREKYNIDDRYDNWLSVNKNYDLNIWIDENVIRGSIYKCTKVKDGCWRTDTDKWLNIFTMKIANSEIE
jgi:hypothetical protein